MAIIVDYHFLVILESLPVLALRPECCRQYFHGHVRDSTTNGDCLTCLRLGLGIKSRMKQSGSIALQ